jgi:catechol 2,3-dioxygenase-like lactoylglutathione lyase family enzyme
MPSNRPGSPPADDILAPATLGQISRTVSDIAEAEAWYRDVLGLKHLYTFGTLAFFDCGGTRPARRTTARDHGSDEAARLRQAVGRGDSAES